MKILVNEDLYTWVDAMYKHCTSCPGDKVQLLDGFLVMGDDSKIRTEDGKAIITLSGERDLRIICFESTSNCLDPIDMPITLKIPIDEKATIDTDTFQITYADPKEYDKEDIPVHELKKTEEFYKLFGESFKEVELKSYRRFGKPSEIADQLEELRQYKLREENKIDDAYENIDTEAARKLIGSLNMILEDYSRVK